MYFDPPTFTTIEANLERICAEAQVRPSDEDVEVIALRAEVEEERFQKDRAIPGRHTFHFRHGPSTAILSFERLGIQECNTTIHAPEFVKGSLEVVRSNLDFVNKVMYFGLLLEKTFKVGILTLPSYRKPERDRGLQIPNQFFADEGERGRVRRYGRHVHEVRERPSKDRR